ncbi:MAG: FAD-dependent oxidoreductase [Planctomycetales bacterium]|nr:FAD-dependent oxidoreductase [Planctomycetales bacterium]
MTIADSPQSVVVIGAGMVGCSCAYYLARRGWQVTLLDQGEVGSGCSHGNCGYICPSHVLPMARPGAITHTLKTMLGKDSPVSMKLSVGLREWRWLYQFARRCRREPMLVAATARQALLNWSMDLYRQLLADENLDCEWQDEGLLFVFHRQRDFEAYSQTDALLRERFQLGADRYDGTALTELEPALLPGLAGAWHYRSDAHLRPDRLMQKWPEVLTRYGVEIIPNVAVKELRAEGGKLAGVTTSQGELSAARYVLATGAKSPLLCKHLPFQLPIQPAKGYSITMPRPDTTPRIPLILEDYHVGVTPMTSGYRLGSTFELAGYDASINQQRVGLLRRAAEKSLRSPYCEPVEEVWTGWRPMTPDGVPYLGRAPHVENLLLATGHGMLGMSMGPGTGALIAELASEVEPTIDPTPYSAAR